MTKKMIRAELRSQADTKLLLKLPKWLEDVKFSPAGAAAPAKDGYWNVSIGAGKKLRVFTK